jgi:putative hydrolase of the HAD superfamily
MPKSRIKAVIFDFRDTIIDIKPTFKDRVDSVRKFVKAGHYKLSDEEVVRNLENARQETIKKLAGKAKVYDFDFQLKIFLKLCNIKLSKKKFKEFHDKFFEAIYRNIKLYDDAKEMLQFLKKSRFKIGLVIDGNPTVEKNIIKMLKIGKFFNSVIISEAVGYPKITGIPLKRCVKALGVNPNNVIVVGDRIDKDISPANSIGAISVRIIREDSRYSLDLPNVNDVEPQFTISSLSELKKMV